MTTSTKVHENLSLENLPNEIWKDIPDYEGYYQVSNYGRVKSLKRLCVSSNGQRRVLKEKIMKPYINNTYTYCKFGKKHYGCHQLVAMAFLGHKPNGYTIIVDHIDNDPLNNCVDNLQLLTPRDNLSKDKINTTSKFTGVHYHIRNKNWYARIYFNGKRHHIGSYTSEIEAHKAYQKKLKDIS